MNVRTEAIRQMELAGNATFAYRLETGADPWHMLPYYPGYDREDVTNMTAVLLGIPELAIDVSTEEIYRFTSSLRRALVETKASADQND